MNRHAKDVFASSPRSGAYSLTVRLYDVCLAFVSLSTRTGKEMASLHFCQNG